MREDRFGSTCQTCCSIVLHAEEIPGEDKTLDIVVDLFNRLNSSGTKLSKGNLALAKLGAAPPGSGRRQRRSQG